MDAAKHSSCERAARLVEEYGGLAEQVVIELANVTPEALQSIIERFGKHPLDFDVPWQAETVAEEKFAITHHKHIDLGSGVLVNVAWTEFLEERFAAIQRAGYAKREIMATEERRES